MFFLIFLGLLCGGRNRIIFKVGLKKIFFSPRARRTNMCIGAKEVRQGGGKMTQKNIIDRSVRHIDKDFLGQREIFKFRRGGGDKFSSFEL